MVTENLKSNIMSCDLVTNSPLVTYFETKLNDEHIKNESMDIFDNCDASTVVNVSLLKKEKNRPNRSIINKLQHETEDSLENSRTGSEIPASETELTKDRIDHSVDHVVKVVGWLEGSLFESHEDCDNDEATESFVTKTWLDENSPSPSLTKNPRRVRVFLLEVEPSLDNEPLDLVSGYCYDGCKRFSTYSTVVWSQQDSYDIPMCHNCAKTDIKKEVRLMFKFKLKVMDTNGRHADLNVWKESGEQFFGCSTEDFVSNCSVRAAAVTPLRQNTLANTIYEEYTPFLDLYVVCIKDIFFVVNSRLKQTNKSRKMQDIVDVTEPTQVNKCIPDD